MYVESKERKSTAGVIPTAPKVSVTCVTTIVRLFEQHILLKLQLYHEI